MTPEETTIIAAHQQAAPVDITSLATALGLSVYDSYEMDPGISGMISRDNSGESASGYAISVNATESYRRRRFTVAHECAHYLLHRSKIGDALTDDAMYRSDNVTSQEEFQANNLAAELLMPRRLMNFEIRKGFVNVEGLADRFDVSPPAMKVRLRFLYQIKSD